MSAKSTKSLLQSTFSSIFFKLSGETNVQSQLNGTDLYLPSNMASVILAESKGSSEKKTKFTSGRDWLGKEINEHQQTISVISMDWQGGSLDKNTCACMRTQLSPYSIKRARCDCNYLWLQGCDWGSETGRSLGFVGQPTEPLSFRFRENCFIDLRQRKIE